MYNVKVLYTLPEPAMETTGLQPLWESTFWKKERVLSSLKLEDGRRPEKCGGVEKAMADFGPESWEAKEVAISETKMATFHLSIC